MRYEKPTVVDYGDLLELTAGTEILGTEDGGTKVPPFTNHMSEPH